MFSTNDLAFIRGIACECHGTGTIAGVSEELSVWTTLGNYCQADTFTYEQASVIKYCAQECERQNSGAMSVYRMVVAWDKACDYKNQGVGIEDDMLWELAAIIEPDKNAAGYRRVNVTARGGILTGSEPQLIERHMRELGDMLSACQATRETIEHLGQKLTPQWFYERFETIHPFADGNGRTGKILYNYLLDRLHAPLLPAYPAGFTKI